jgi:hypothetical protein
MAGQQKSDDRAVSVVIEDKGDRVDAATRASGTPAREPPVAEPHESRAEPANGVAPAGP